MNLETILVGAICFWLGWVISSWRNYSKGRREERALWVRDLQGYGDGEVGNQVKDGD